MRTILMQGDSITDFGRDRSNTRSYERGHGYATMTAGQIMASHPGQYDVINRGVSGDRIVDLFARIKADFINLKPDYLTILIGVNDVWHDLEWSNGVSSEKFYQVYSMLIDELLEALPNLKIYLLEPFVLPGSATNAMWADFQREVSLRARSVRRIAEERSLTFIPLQAMFDECCTQCPADYWLFDGVHPTAAGHAMITRALLAALEPDLQ